MALTSALAWSLELLLDEDGVEQPTVTTLLNLYCGGDVRLLPKVSQCRLLLRLVHDTAAGLPPDLADHFASLAAWSREDPSGFPAGVSLAQICPPPELVARVRAAPGRPGQRVDIRLTSSRPAQVKTSMVLAAAGENPQKGLDVLGKVYAGLVVDQSEASQQELAQCGPRPFALIHLVPRRAALLLLARLRRQPLPVKRGLRP